MEESQIKKQQAVDSGSDLNPTTLEVLSLVLHYRLSTDRKFSRTYRSKKAVIDALLPTSSKIPLGADVVYVMSYEVIRNDLKETQVTSDEKSKEFGKIERTNLRCDIISNAFKNMLGTKAVTCKHMVSVMECLVSVVGYNVSDVTALIQFLAKLFQMENVKSANITVDRWIANQGGWNRILAKTVSQSCREDGESKENNLPTQILTQPPNSPPISYRNSDKSAIPNRSTYETKEAVMTASGTTTCIELESRQQTKSGITSSSVITFDKELCPCGALKPPVPFRIGQCSSCNQFVCMYPGCKGTARTRTTLRTQQWRTHRNEIFVSLYSGKYCKCGQVKSRGRYRSFIACPKAGCKRYWCNRTPCFEDFFDFYHLTLHWWSHHHDELSQEIHRCGYCHQTAKLRNPPPADKLQCSKCNIFWCLIGDCPLEFTTLSSLRNHQQRHLRE